MEREWNGRILVPFVKQKKRGATCEKSHGCGFFRDSNLFEIGIYVAELSDKVGIPKLRLMERNR